MTDKPCPSCTRPTSDGLLCGVCTLRFRDDLDNLPEWLAHLDDALARQMQTGTGNGGKSAETAVPYDTNASRVRDDVRNTLSTWVRELNIYGQAWPANTMPAMVRWLSAHVDQVRGHEAADQIVDEIGYCVRQIKAACDVSGPKWYLGVCRGTLTIPGIGGALDVDSICANQLYAPAFADSFRCQRCEIVIDVLERRDEMLALLEHQWATLENSVSVLSLFGLPAELGTIKRWAAMGILLPNDDGKFRVGDVADIARDTVAERVRGA